MPKHLNRRTMLTTGAMLTTASAIGAGAGSAAATETTGATETTDIIGHGRELRAERDAIDTTIQMGVLFDRRQWGTLREVFTSRVWADYSALTGAKPTIVPAEELVGGWQRNLGHLSATQHLLGNQCVQLHGGEAQVTADFQATHRLGPIIGGRLWILGGHYRYGLTRTNRTWRINALTMVPLWENGDRTIIGLPAQGS